MKILGIGKITREDGVVTERRYIVEITEAEADMITGVAGRPHIAGSQRFTIRSNESTKGTLKLWRRPKNFNPTPQIWKTLYH